MTAELDPALLTGIADIDAQHRELFHRVRALLEASRTRGSREEVIRILEFLGSYVVDHFSAEEGRMAAEQYPELAAHQAEHRQLVKQLEILRLELKSEGPSSRFVFRVENRVREWLREHIYRTDRLLAEWLRSRQR